MEKALPPVEAHKVAEDLRVRAQDLRTLLAAAIAESRFLREESSRLRTASHGSRMRFDDDDRESEIDPEFLWSSPEDWTFCFNGRERL